MPLLPDRLHAFCRSRELLSEDTHNSRYDAFGENIGGTGNVDNKYLFAGEQYDSNLGDYYLRARYYDADTGRFARRDSYEGSISRPSSLHRYVYANGNPVNFVDPNGLFTIAEVSAGETIRNYLAGIQASSGGYLLSAAQKRGDYKIGDFLVDVSWNAAFALAPLLLPYIVNPAAAVLRRAQAAFSSPRGGAGVGGLPAIGEIRDASVLPQLGANACGPTCGAMLLSDYGVNVSRTQVAQAGGSVFMDKGELATALNTLGSSGSKTWYGVATNQLDALNSRGPWAALIGEGYGNHWVIVDGYDGARNLKIRDPFEGTRYTVKVEDFKSFWRNIAVHPG